MSSTTTTSILESTTVSLSPGGDSHSYGAARYAAEKEGATNRFAAAQKLFKDQAASQPKRPVPTPLTRQRTNTSTSLYTKLDHSVSSSGPSHLQGSPLSPNNASFADAFMKNKARQIPKTEVASALASSSCPPTPVDTGCILLGPRRALQALDVTRQIQARSDSGSPAWYCRHDKLVIFDGVDESNGTPKLVTRSSRGLDMARRNCPRTTIKVDLPCSHCQDLLKRKTWMFEERMLECRVCKTCQDRCWHEWDKQQKANPQSIAPLPEVPIQPTTDDSKQYVIETLEQVPSEMESENTKAIETNTKRDSFLQDEDVPA